MEGMNNLNMFLSIKYIYLTDKFFEINLFDWKLIYVIINILKILIIGKY